MNPDSSINKQVVSQKGGVNCFDAVGAKKRKAEIAAGPATPEYKSALEEKEECDKIKKKLALIDSIHDFGKTGERNAKATLKRLFDRADARLGDFTPAPGLRKIASCKGHPAQKRNVSFERRTTAKLDNCQLEKAFSKAITWENIINSNSASDLAAKMGAPGPNNNILVIQNGPTQTFSYSRALKTRKGNVGKYTRIQARNRVANFVLHYMFPDYKDETVGVTYDAGGSMITTIFSDIGQVKAVITPTNIADSAITSLDPYQNFKQFGHKRTDFIFPQADPKATTLESWIYNTDSTLFLHKLAAKSGHPNVNVSLENENFNVNNPNGFKMRIGRPSDPVVEINYDKWDKNTPSGPSAPYLATALEKSKWAGHDGARTVLPNKSTIIPLSKWDTKPRNAELLNDPDFWKSMLVDIKRTGDYEQVNAAIAVQNMMPNLKLILGTGDVLCSTYARMRGQACILAGLGCSGDEEGCKPIVLFRNPKDVSKELVEKMKKVARERQGKLDKKWVEAHSSEVYNMEDTNQRIAGLTNIFEVPRFVNDFNKSWIDKKKIGDSLWKVKLINLLTNILRFKVIKSLKGAAEAHPSWEAALRLIVPAVTNAQVATFDQWRLAREMLEKDVGPIINVFLKEAPAADDFVQWSAPIVKVARDGGALAPLAPLPNEVPPFLKKIGFNFKSLRRYVQTIYNFIDRFPDIPAEEGRTRDVAMRRAIKLKDGFSNGELKTNITDILAIPDYPFLTNFGDTLVTTITSGPFLARRPGAAEERSAIMTAFSQKVVANLPADGTLRLAEALAEEHVHLNQAPVQHPQYGGAQHGGNKPLEQQAIANFFTNINDTIDLIASKCNNILIERMNSFAVSNRRELDLGAYSIFYNLFKVINRWYNATTTISVEYEDQPRLIVIPPREHDFKESMLGIKQQAQWWVKQQDKADNPATVPPNCQQIIRKISSTSLNNLAEGGRAARVASILTKYLGAYYEKDMGNCRKIKGFSRTRRICAHLNKVKRIVMRMRESIMTDEIRNFMRRPLDSDVAADLRDIWINRLWEHVDILADRTGKIFVISDNKGEPQIVPDLQKFLDINLITEHLENALIYNLVGFSRLYNRLQFNFMSFDIISTPSKKFVAELESRFMKQNPLSLPQDPVIIAKQTNIIQDILDADAIFKNDPAGVSKSNRLDAEAEQVWGNHIFYIIELPGGRTKEGKFYYYDLSSPIQMWSLAPRNGHSGDSGPGGRKVMAHPLGPAAAAANPRPHVLLSIDQTYVHQTPSWSPGTAPPITPSGQQRRGSTKNKNAATARAAAAAAKRLNGSRSKKRKDVLSRRRHSPQSNYMSDGGGKRAHTKKRRRRRRNTKRREQRKQSKRRKRKQKKFTRRRRKR